MKLHRCPTEYKKPNFKTVTSKILLKNCNQVWLVLACILAGMRGSHKHFQPIL